MRTSLRLALPAVVTAAALALTGCGGDDKDKEPSEPPEELTEPLGDAESGDSGGDSGAGVEGTWVTGTSDSDSVLEITADTVMFTETIGGGMDSAWCTGEVSGETMTLSCDNGETEWNEASLSRDGDTLTVDWASGTSQTYRPAEGEIPGI